MPQLPPTFRPRHQPGRAEVRRAADQRRGSARARGYSARWDKASRGYRKAHPLCLGCQAVGEVRAAEVVDHVVPPKGDRALFWDHDNWQPACSALCHSRVKQALEARWLRGELPDEALRLDSPAAIETRRQMLGVRA